MSDKQIANTERLSKEQLLEIFDSFLSVSGFKKKEFNYNETPFNVKIEDPGRIIDIHFLLKNVSGGGWKENKEIKRIQIGNIKDKLVTTNKKRTHMLCGITKFKDKNILIVWNSYLYTKHLTNRSCYIHTDTIERCYENGYVFSHEFDQEIWLCDETKFGLLVRDYISYNYLG